jgi:tetratricopeptide (TPR) repeat protein
VSFHCFACQNFRAAVAIFLFGVLPDYCWGAEQTAQELAEAGRARFERKELSQAAEYFERSLALDSQQGAVHYQLGLVYRDLGNPGKAAKEFAAAADRGFRNLGVTFNLIAAYFASRQAAAGLELAEQGIGEISKSPDLAFRLGKLLFEHLYYKDALDQFQTAFAHASNDFERRFYLALTHFQLNQFAETIRLLSSDQERTKNPEIANLLAAGYAKAGAPGTAVELLQEVIRKAPSSPHAYLNLAFLRLEQTQIEEALTLFNNFRALGSQRNAKVFYAVERNSCPELMAEIRADQGWRAEPDQADFYLDMASQMQERYHYATAVELLRITRRYEGNSARLFDSAGVSCLNLAPQGPEAFWLLQEAVKLEPSRDWDWYLLGRAYLRQSKAEQALEAFRRALSIQPRGAYAMGIGRALLSIQGPDAEQSRRSAKSAFDQAVALEPSSAVAHFELGKLLSKDGAYAQARNHLARAVELEPDFYEAHYVLSQVCSRAGDPEGTRNHLELFRRAKQAAERQSVVGAGFVSEGREF